MQNLNPGDVWADNRGTTAVEFAMVAPVFILLLVGTVCLCITLFLVGSLHYAVEEGARCASVKTSVCTDSTSIVSYTQNHYFGPSAPHFNYAAAACGSSVSASLTYVMNLGITSVSVPVTASACFP